MQLQVGYDKKIHGFLTEQEDLKWFQDMQVQIRRNRSIELWIITYMA
jgi:hypothetical protein